MHLFYINISSVGFTPEEEAAFEEEGISLWKQLQKELAPNYQVAYFSEKLQKLVQQNSGVRSQKSEVKASWCLSFDFQFVPHVLEICCK